MSGLCARLTETHVSLHDSIREFCDLKMPILMFDRDGNYCVLRLEEVSRRSVVHVSTDQCLTSSSSFFPCHLDQNT